jgi:hypothetical protein
MNNRILIILFSLLIFSCSVLKWNYKNGKPLVAFNEVNTLINSNLLLDTIYIKKGVYENLKFELVGVHKSLTIIPEEIGEVIITGNAELIFKSCNELKFEGFYFTNTSSRDLITLDSTSNMFISNNYFFHVGGHRFGKILRLQNGSNNNLIFNNTFEDLKSMGIVFICSENLMVSKDNIIRNNYFINVKNTKYYYPSSDGNGLECVQIGQGAIPTIVQETNTLITENTFENIVGDRAEIISIKSSKSKIENNLFLNNDSGVTIRYGNYNVFTRNKFINTRAGLRIFGKGNEITNNTFYGGDFAIVLPTTDYQNDQVIDVVGYYQQIDNTIINNSIIYPKVSAFRIAGGSRKYVPEKNTIEENIIVLQEETKDIELGKESIMRANTIRGNRTEVERKINQEKFQEVIQIKRGANFSRPSN